MNNTFSTRMGVIDALRLLTTQPATENEPSDLLVVNGRARTTLATAANLGNVLWCFFQNSNFRLL